MHSGGVQEYTVGMFAKDLILRCKAALGTWNKLAMATGLGEKHLMKIAREKRREIALKTAANCAEAANIDDRLRDYSTIKKQ